MELTNCPYCNSELFNYKLYGCIVRFFKCQNCNLVFEKYAISNSIYCLIFSSKKFETSIIPSNFYESRISKLYHCFIDIKGFIPKYFLSRNFQKNIDSYYEISEMNNNLSVNLIAKHETILSINDSNLDKKLKTVLTFL